MKHFSFLFTAGSACIYYWNIICTTQVTIMWLKRILVHAKHELKTPLEE